jgi:hypothetical protein
VAMRTTGRMPTMMMWMKLMMMLYVKMMSALSQTRVCHDHDRDHSRGSSALVTPSPPSSLLHGVWSR